MESGVSCFGIRYCLGSIRNERLLSVDCKITEKPDQIPVTGGRILKKVRMADWESGNRSDPLADAMVIWRYSPQLG
jgi:hypothetical protein